MAGLALSLLGPPSIERDRAAVGFDTRKATALLAYLAITRRPHSREALSALLWPQQDPEHARGSLRRTLSTLRKALGESSLEVSRGSIGLNDAADVVVDVERFRSLLDDGSDRALTEAVELYRGDFMAGFALRDSVEFEHWQLFEADGLRRELAGGLERLVDAQAVRGEYARAIVHASRWLALDPLQEPAHRQLIRLYAWSGERAAALSQYRDCVRRLGRELGVAPLAETTQLYRAINEGDVSPPPPLAARERRTPEPADGSPPAVESSVAGVTRMVGRLAEWELLLETHAAIRQDGRLVVIEGEAGIGKTRLAHAFLAHARERGAPTAALRCYEEENGLAYEPIVEALRTVLGGVAAQGWMAEVPEHWLSEAGRLVPELPQLRPGLPEAPPLDGPGAQSRFFEGIRQAFLTAAEGAPAPVLLFDDLHSSDEASLDVLTYLLHRMKGWPLCLVLTWRTERVPLGHRLRRLLSGLERDGVATGLVLDRLSESEVAELVRSTGDEPSLELSRRLYRESEGLPLFLIEYLAAVRPAAGVEPDWALPGGVRDLLRVRVDALGETARQVFSTAAVIGRSFELDTLREASGRSEEETATAVEELLAQGFVEELRGAESPIYDFKHDQVRALVYEETSLARRRLLHRRVAEALAGRARDATRGPSSAVIAYHWRLAGDDSRAALHHRAAGDHARSLYANADALVHLQDALALGHPDVAALHEAIGDLQTLGGDYGAAVASYETAAAQSAGSALAEVEHKLANVHHRRGDWELADSHFDAAVAALGEGGGGDLAHILADRSLTAHRRGHSDRAGELAREAREVAQTAGDERALARAHNILGIVASARGEFDDAVGQLERSLALAESIGDRSARIAALNNLALAHRGRGDLAAALGLTDTALELCAAQGDRHREAALHNNKADLLHALHRPEDAMAHLKEAVAIFADVGAADGMMQPEIWKLVEW